MQNKILLGICPNLFMQNNFFKIFSWSEEREFYFLFL